MTVFEANSEAREYAVGVIVSVERAECRFPEQSALGTVYSTFMKGHFERLPYNQLPKISRIRATNGAGQSGMIFLSNRTI